VADAGRGHTVCALDCWPCHLGWWMANTWQWQVFATLTHRDPEEIGSSFTHLGVGGAERQLIRWWDHSVRPRAPGAFAWFQMEAHKARPTPHWHGLVGGVPSDLQRSDLWAEWFNAPRGGMARIEPVRDADGVALYVAKYVTKDMGKPWFLGNLRDARRLPSDLLPAGKENDDRRSHLYNSITTHEVGGHA